MQPQSDNLTEKISDLIVMFESGDTNALKEFVDLATESGLLFSQVGFFECARNAVEQSCFNVYSGKERVSTIDLSDFKIEISQELDRAGYPKYKILKK